MKYGIKIKFESGWFWIFDVTESDFGTNSAPFTFETEEEAEEYGLNMYDSDAVWKVEEWKYDS